MTKARAPFRLTPLLIPEQDIHEAIARVLDLALPPNSVHFAVDSAGKASAIVGARLKARGGKRGVPDHFIGWNGRVLWLEIKTDGGVLSVDQIRMHAVLRAAGMNVFLVRSPADALVALRQAAIPVSARISA